ncbi:MAG: biopolymer transporter ExbD [Flavobacteriales bacterium]|nr:biopolymer transporter ExbD [Flavobacteriales bacterium]
MAEISNTGTRSSSRRSSTPIKIDMTPLVDLGFLLITFFMLTTHLIDQRVMDLKLPLPGNPTMADNTLTILLDAQGRRFGYQGAFHASTQLQPLDGRSLGNSLRSFRALSALAEEEPICIVKVADGVRYQQVVTIVDEIRSAAIDRSSLADSISASERSLMAGMRQR